LDDGGDEAAEFVEVEIGVHGCLRHFVGAVREK
jgi:hypothetical protein